MLPVNKNNNSLSTSARVFAYSPKHVVPTTRWGVSVVADVVVVVVFLAVGGVVRAVVAVVAVTGAALVEVVVDGIVVVVAAVVVVSVACIVAVVACWLGLLLSLLWLHPSGGLCHVPAKHAHMTMRSWAYTHTRHTHTERAQGQHPEHLQGQSHTSPTPQLRSA